MARDGNNKGFRRSYTKLEEGRRRHTKLFQEANNSSLNINGDIDIRYFFCKRVGAMLFTLR